MGDRCGGNSPRAFLVLVGNLSRRAPLKRLNDFEFSPRPFGDFRCALASMRQIE